MVKSLFSGYVIFSELHPGFVCASEVGALDELTKRGDWPAQFLVTSGTFLFVPVRVPSPPEAARPSEPCLETRGHQGIASPRKHTRRASHEGTLGPSATGMSEGGLSPGTGVSEEVQTSGREGRGRTAGEVLSREGTSLRSLWGSRGRGAPGESGRRGAGLQDG